MSNRSITVQQEDFDIGAVTEELRSLGTHTGAICTFTGLVRDLSGKDDDSPEELEELFLEHYPGMTENALQEIVDEAWSRWPLNGCKVIHRVGPLKLGDQIVLVATASAHRQAAFDAANFIMDYLKTRAPFWKRQTSAGQSSWVEQRESDDRAMERWQKD